jgi:hypothetical protein
MNFDRQIRLVTRDRGKVYGNPLDHFATIDTMKKAMSSCPHNGVRHALEMMACKMARLCETPDHFDSALDIAGYARVICMINDEEEKRDGTPTKPRRQPSSVSY